MIEYRRADASDAEAVALLHVRSWRESYRGEFTDAFLDEDQPDERLRVWHERLTDPASSQLVQLAVRGTSLEAFVCVYADHDPTWGSFVDNLHVAATAKRIGLGSALMTQAGGWLEQSSSHPGIYLWVLESNSTARRFYEQLGASNAGVARMETHGGAMVRSCQYVWPDARRLVGQ